MEEFDNKLFKTHCINLKKEWKQDNKYFGRKEIRKAAKDTRFWRPEFYKACQKIIAEMDDSLT